MKIAFSTLGCPTWSWNKIINEAEKNGYHGLEIRGIEDEIYLPKAFPFLKENQEKTMEGLAQKNLIITDLGTASSFHNPEKYSSSVKEGKDYIDLANELKVPYIRIFGDKIPDLSKKEETIDAIANGINELCKYASHKGVVCLLETHGDIVSIENIEPIINKIKHKNFGIIWDVGHTFKIYGDDISKFLDKMWKYIKHVHIKDLKRVNNQLELCMIGDGVIPVPELIKELKKRGYKGYISLEWEKRWHNSLEEPEVVIPFYAEYLRKYI
ncbi:sugar phosphate isomerase/epimerase family protein [Clostridium sp. DL1XJH146]